MKVFSKFGSVKEITTQNEQTKVITMSSFEETVAA